jgi:cell wall assembly regulator SMI1
MADAAQQLTQDLLAELEQRWRAQGAAIADHLLEGLPISEMDRLAEAAGLSLPDEARTWWGWHDGADDMDSPAGQLGPLRFFMPLDQAIDERRDHLELAVEAAGRMPAGDPGAEPDYWFRSSWLPIIPGAKPVVVECDVPPGVASPVYVAVPGEEPHQPRALSLGAAVALWVAALDQGAWRWDRVRRAWDLDGSHLTPQQTGSRLA